MVEDADTVSSQQVAGVLERKIQSGTADNLPSTFAVTDSALLREARAEQVSQAVKVSTAVQAMQPEIGV